MGIQIQPTKVVIDSFETGVLGVDLTAKSSGNQLLDYIRKSPMAKNLEVDDVIEIGGKQQLELTFDVSIKDGVKTEFKPTGQIQFDQGLFNTAHFYLDQINGLVELQGYDLQMNELAANLNGSAVKLDGVIATKTASGLMVDVDIIGNFGSELILDSVQPALPIIGQANWLINLKSKKAKGLSLRAQTDLAGITSELPAPLNKTKDEIKTLHIECDIPCNESVIQVNYDEQDHIDHRCQVRCI